MKSLCMRAVRFVLLCLCPCLCCDQDFAHRATSDDEEKAIFQVLTDDQIDHLYVLYERYFDNHRLNYGLLAADTRAGLRGTDGPLAAPGCVVPQDPMCELVWEAWKALRSIAFYCFANDDRGYKPCMDDQAKRETLRSLMLD